MKRAENRLNVDTLFVFGAGASYCASSMNGGERQTPLDKDFCARLEDISTQKPAWVNVSRDTLSKAWKDHLPFRDYGLEQAIIRHLGHTEFRRAIHKRKNIGVLADAEYINHVAHLVCYVLRKAREGRAAPYKALADTFFARGDEPNRVISFNYDELLDVHLLPRLSRQQLYFDKIDLGPHAVARRKELYPDPVLVKLHGSVNWRCAKRDLLAIVNGPPGRDEEHVIDKVWFSERGTPSPDEDASPLIIPPLPQKPITRIRLFCFLWTKAYEYLHEAKELVICGYSLPETDRLAQSMFGSFENRRLSSITVIDPNPAILAKWRALFRRPSIASRAKWTHFESFSEYMKHGV